MRSFHIKSILLGIGIGIVFTSIISMIYMAGIGSGTRMSREEIITEARKYGMVEGNGFVVESTSKPESGSDSTRLNDNKDRDASTPAAIQPTSTPQAPTQSEEVKIAVNPGDSSEIVAERLLKADLISDKAAFKKRLADMGLATEIDVGEFKITKGSDQDKIIRILTGRQ